MNKFNNSKPVYKRVWFWVLIAIVSIGVVNGILNTPSKNTAGKTEKTISTTVEQKFKMTKELGEEFALYFKENAEVLDKGEKVDFVPGGDDKNLSVLKAKNTIFEKWAQEKGYNVDLEKDTPQLLVYTSDSAKTQISQEYKGEMKILK